MCSDQAMNGATGRLLAGLILEGEHSPSSRLLAVRALITRKSLQNGLDQRL
jgi:hypothetical protein